MPQPGFHIDRRRLLAQAGLGAPALWSLLRAEDHPGLGLHHRPRARRAVFLFQSGAPSQLDLFDPKPGLRRFQGQELPDSVRRGQRLTGMTSGQKAFKIAASRFRFRRYGQCGMELSELLPHTGAIADDICLVRSMHTEAINHDPAITFFQTGSQQPGRPSLGSWLSVGLGSVNQNLPGFVVLISHGSSRRDAQPLFARLWGAGFLPANHQGVLFRGSGDPVLYLGDPKGLSRAQRRRGLDALAELQAAQQEAERDPQIDARVQQYEMAYRMQASVPELTDFRDEPDSTFELYGPEARKPGTFAANCLLARRLLERDVRFVQLFHRGWDQHFNLPRDISLQCQDTDRPSAALVSDLKRRGLLDDTLVVWGGEFGRTTYCQGKLSPQNYGRDHHPRCFSMWLAGGGIRGGMVHGQTDDHSYNIVADPVHVHDLQATILHCLGIDHERLTWRYQGRDFRLTDVAGIVQQALLA